MPHHPVPQDQILETYPYLPPSHNIQSISKSPLSQKHAQNLFFFMPTATTWIEAYIVSHTTAVT